MRIFLSNWQLKVLAVAAAMIFWFLVVATENTFYTFPEEIPVKAFNVPENLVVTEDLGNVTIRLKIDNREVVKNLTVDDFSAYVDLEGTDVGEKDTEIIVSSKKTDLNIVKVEPSKLTVKIEEKAEKEVPIEYEVDGDLKDGYRVKEVNIMDENVIIKGSQDALDKISYATLVLDLTDVDDDVKRKFAVKILDEDGDEIEGVTPDKGEIEAQVIVAAVKDQKITGIKPTIIGTPNENIWIKAIIVDPNFVVLSGEQDVLDEIDFVNTTDINVSGLSENATFNVQVNNLPEGVTVDGSTDVVVNIEVENYDSVNSDLQRKTIKVPVLVRKFNTEQRSIEINPVTVTLVVEGEIDAIDKINSKLNVELDISQLEGTEAQISISENNLNLPNGVSVISLTPSKVNINWEN